MKNTPSARERLIEAGARLISDRGADRINSNQIARAAGVGVGTFYAHFRDKRELRAALALSVADALRLCVQQATAAAENKPEPQVRALVTAVVRYARDNPQLFRAALGSEGGGGSLGRPAVGLSSRAVERRLRALQRDGRVHPALHPGVAARAFTCMQNGVVSWWLEDPSRASEHELIETLVRLHPALVR